MSSASQTDPCCLVAPTLALKTRTGDLGLVNQKSPAVMFLAVMRIVPDCCCSHVPVLLPSSDSASLPLR